MKPGMSGDPATLYRFSGADTDGNPLSARTVAWSGDGRYGTPRAGDAERASRNGQVLDAIYATEAPRGTFRPGDELELRGQVFTVLSETDVRLHVRVGLQRSE